ncbi:MAG: hypothetical protein IBJ00_01735 [Alphaproteobacteria bacterium]|nr:hypothetical protein [Alphaproteobacteria bacterium]
MQKIIHLFISLNICLWLFTGCHDTQTSLNRGELFVTQLESISKKNNTPLDLDSTERNSLIKALNNLPQDIQLKLTDPQFLAHIKLPSSNPFNDQYSPENSAITYIQNICTINSVGTS